MKFNETVLGGWLVVQILRNDGITIRLAWLNESAVRVDKNEYKQREKKGRQSNGRRVPSICS